MSSTGAGSAGGSAPLVRIERRGSLPSMVAWYVVGVPADAPVHPISTRTRREAREWCERHGYRWR